MDRIGELHALGCEDASLNEWRRRFVYLNLSMLRVSVSEPDIVRRSPLSRVFGFERWISTTNYRSSVLDAMSPTVVLLSETVEFYIREEEQALTSKSARLLGVDGIGSEGLSKIPLWHPVQWELPGSQARTWDSDAHLSKRRPRSIQIITTNELRPGHI